MNESLKDYLISRGAKPVGDKILAAHTKAMTQKVIPHIVKDVKLREQLAAEARFSPVAKKAWRGR